MLATIIGSSCQQLFSNSVLLPQLLLEQEVGHWPGVEVTQQSAQNIFDCDKVNSSCRLFYPVDFLERPGAWGHEFREVAKQEALKTLPYNIVRFWHPGKKANASKSLPYEPLFPPPDFTYLHVRKAGGISMLSLAKDFLKQELGKGYKMQKIWAKRHRRHVTGTEGLDGIFRVKEVAKTTQFFTFVRNPISRFPSAMSQVMSGMGIKNVKRLNCSSEDPHTTHPKSMMKCVLNSLSKGNRIDEHFTWAVTEMFQPLVGLNTSVIVMPLSEVDHFMQSLGVDPFRMNSKQTKKRTYGPDLLDDAMIEQLCHIYAADVHMLRFTNLIEVPECDKYVPWKPEK